MCTSDIIFDELNAWEWSDNTNNGTPLFFFLKKTYKGENTHLAASRISPSLSQQSSLESNLGSHQVHKLRDIYELCDVAYTSCEPEKYEVNAKDEKWKKAMERNQCHYEE